MTWRFVLLLFIASTSFGMEIEALLGRICNASINVSLGNEGAQASMDEAINNVKKVYGEKTEEAMLDYLGDFSRSGEQLIGCAVVLREVGTMKSKDKLIEALGQLPTGLMSEAAKALSRLDGEGLAVELATRQAKEGDEDRKAKLDAVLCDLSGKTQFKTLTMWAQSNNSTERRWGISSLRHHPGEEGRRLLRRALFDQDEQVAYIALISLGYIGEKNDLFLLQFLFQQAGVKAKGLDAIALLSALKDAGQRIREREMKPNK